MNALLACTKTRASIIRSVVSQNANRPPVVLHQPHAEVVQRLLRKVCLLHARLGLPMSALYISANRPSSIRGRASFRNTCAQLLRISLAFLGVIRNSDCHRLS